MSKAILISINPKHVMNILNGKKTIELRKTYPHCALPIDVYIYCTSHKNHRESLYELETYKKRRRFDVDYYVPSDPDFILNGKVVAKFTLNHVNMDFLNNVLEPACVSRKEAEDYLEGRPCWQWKIDNLVIFDKPKLLEEFWNNGKKVKGHNGTYQYSKLTRAPQSWCYVEAQVWTINYPNNVQLANTMTTLRDYAISKTK